MRAMINSPLSAKSPLKTMASGRLPKTSGFQSIAQVYGWTARRVSRGREVRAFVSQNAHRT
jgi:hypothetical protein